MKLGTRRISALAVIGCMLASDALSGIVFAESADTEIYGTSSRVSLTCTDVFNAQRAAAVLTDGIYGITGSAGFAVETTNAVNASVELDVNESKEITDVVIHGGHTISTELIAAEGIRIFTENGEGGYSEQTIEKRYEDINTKNLGNNAPRGNQVIYLRLAKPVKASRLKIEFHQPDSAKEMRICEIEAYSEKNNLLFGNPAVYSPAYVNSDDIIENCFDKGAAANYSGDFILTDGDVYGTSEADYLMISNTKESVPFVEYNMDKTPVNEIVIYSDMSSPVFSDYITVAYTEDSYGEWKTAGTQSYAEAYNAGVKKLTIDFAEIYPQRLRIYTSCNAGKIKIKEIEAYMNMAVSYEQSADVGVLRIDRGECDKKGEPVLTARNSSTYFTSGGNVEIESEKTEREFLVTLSSSPKNNRITVNNGATVLKSDVIVRNTKGYKDSNIKQGETPDDEAYFAYVKLGRMENGKEYTVSCDGNELFAFNAVNTLPEEGSAQDLKAADIRIKRTDGKGDKSLASEPNYSPAILSDGLFGNSQGSYAIYFGAANARMTPSVILKGEETNVTHIAIYAGVSGNADMVDAGSVRVYNYNESTASYEEIGISGYDTVDNGTNTGLNNSASESSVRANQIVFLKLDRAVRTNELKVEFNQSTPFRICETEAYYAPQNKLFGKAMSDFAPEYPESEFGKNIINGGFVLTDGERQGCFDHKLWSVNNTADDVYAEYGVDGEKINRLVVYSGNGEGTGTVDAVELEYTVDGTDWVKADFEKEEQTGEKLIAEFDSIYPKKIRVHILSPETVVVREIEAYDDSVTAPIEPEYFDADGYDYDTETNALCSTQLKQISFIGGKCINERIIADGKAGSAAGVYSSAWVIDEGENACAEFFFSSPVAVNKIQLTSGWRDMSEDGIVSDITLQIYEDGEYTDIAVITGNTSKMAITSFPVVSASRYRVLLGADNAMRIREIQLNYAVYAIAFEKEFGNDGIITTGRCDNRIIAEYDGEYTVELTVNGEATAVDEAGRFTLDIDKNGIYELCAVISDVKTGMQLAVFTKTLIAADFSEIIRQINDGESSVREFRQNLLNNSALAEKYGYDVSAAVNDSDGAIGLLIEKLREKAPYEESPAGFERLIDDIKNAMPGCSINGAETGGQMQYALENYAGILGFDCNEIYDFAQQQKTEVSMIAAEIVAYREKVLQGRLDADNYEAAFRYAMAMTAYNISYYGSLSSVFDKYNDVCSIDYSVIENKYLDVTYRRLKSFHVEKYTDIPALLMKAYNDTKSSAPQNTQSGGGSGGGSVYYKEQPATNPRDDDIKNETEPYRDMNGYEWAKESVARLTELGVVSGNGDGEFCPGDNVTREQFIKMIVTAMQLEIHKTVNRFEDVTDGAWYSSYVLTGCSYGITRGISETVFGVGMPITRQDMAVITYRAAECRMYGFKDDTMSFADEADISDYALTAVRRMAGNGIINGVGDNCFAPKNLSTRAEAAVMICRLLTSMEGK